MSTKFKVGDRVAVYDREFTGFRRVGFVACVGSDGNLLVNGLENILHRSWFSSKVCRRLVKKTRK